MSLRSATIAAHAGVPEPRSVSAPHVAPLVQVSAYDFPTIAASEPAMQGDGYVYARHGLPNPDQLARAVAALEGADAGVATSSGMGAIAAALLSVCRAGDRVAVQREAYGGTWALAATDLARVGIAAVPFDARDPAAVEAAVAGAAACLVETISNPLLRRCDIAAVAERCRAHGTALIVDNTFATPLGAQPLADGADLVVHSATKFIGGHHDLCAGVVVGPRDRVDAARGVARRMGLMAAAMDAWLAVRGLRTLEVRMRRAWDNAAHIAHRLRADSRVRAVYAADRCALVSFDVGDRAAAERWVAGLRLIALAPSLGGVTTTVAHPATSSHRALPPRERAALGIGDGLLRVSVGIEHVDDLVADLCRGHTTDP